MHLTVRHICFKTARLHLPLASPAWISGVAGAVSPPLFKPITVRELTLREAAELIGTSVCCGNIESRFAGCSQWSAGARGPRFGSWDEHRNSCEWCSPVARHSLLFSVQPLCTGNIIKRESPGDVENGKQGCGLQGEECVQAENALQRSREDLQARHNASSKPDDDKSSATCSDFPGSKVWWSGASQEKGGANSNSVDHSAIWCLSAVSLLFLYNPAILLQLILQWTKCMSQSTCHGWGRMFTRSCDSLCRPRSVAGAKPISLQLLHVALCLFLLQSICVCFSSLMSCLCTESTCGRLTQASHVYMFEFCTIQACSERSIAEVAQDGRKSHPFFCSANS